MDRPSVGGQENPPPPAGLPPMPPPVLPPVTTQDLLDGLKHPARWLTYSGDYTGRRHSPLKQITRGQRAAPRGAVDVPGRGDGDRPRLRVHAAGDGRRALHHRQQQRGVGDRRAHRPADLALSAGAAAGPHLRARQPVNRGFAALGDRLFMSTLDGAPARVRSQHRPRGVGRRRRRLQGRPRAHRRAARRQGQGDRRQLRRRPADARLHRRVRSAAPARGSGASTRFPAPASRAAKPGPTPTCCRAAAARRG